jgi:endonuclease YncB( thermonuclease family)
MRKSWIIGGLVLAALAIAGAWRLGAPPPGKPVETTAAIAVPTPPPAETMQAAAPTAPPSAESQAPAPPAVAALPPLPTRAIPEWQTHAVPEDSVPPPPKPLDLRVSPSGNASLPPPPSYRPFDSLQSSTAAGSASSGSAGAASTPGPRGGTGPQIAGTAEAAGANVLRVGGRPLHLFGIRPPASGDRCAETGTTPLTSGAQARGTSPCLDQAQGLLAARLSGKAKVSCRFPGAVRQDSPAICLDGDGVDLAGVLVAEGLALADPAQSYDYVGAEGVARSQKRGLWLFR